MDFFRLLMIWVIESGSLQNETSLCVLFVFKRYISLFNYAPIAQIYKSLSGLVWMLFVLTVLKYVDLLLLQYFVCWLLSYLFNVRTELFWSLVCALLIVYTC